jgi:WD40 repeat protein
MICQKTPSRPDFVFSIFGALLLVAVLGVAATTPDEHTITEVYHFPTTMPDGFNIRGSAFGPENQLVTGWGVGVARVWDVSRGTSVQSFRGGREPIAGDCVQACPYGVAFSPDASLVLTGSIEYLGAKGPWQFTNVGVHIQPPSETVCDYDAHLFDVKTGREVQVFTGHEKIVGAVSFSKDGNHVATASQDKTIRLWDIRTGREIKGFSDHDESVTSVAFSPDGRFLGSADGGGRVVVREIATNAEILRAETNHFLMCVVFSPDSKMVAVGGARDSIFIWRLSDAKKTSEIRTPGKVSFAMAFLPEGGLIADLATWTDGTRKGGSTRMAIINVYDIETGSEVCKSAELSGSVMGLSVAPGGGLLASTGADGVRVWKLPVSLNGK